jgi:translation elongation factor EF-G
LVVTGAAPYREALRASVMQLLEPVVEVAVTVPDDAVGGVLGDLAARRGHVVGSAMRAGTAVVTVTVPLAELFGYANRLHSRTQGQGTFTTRPTGHVPAPLGQRPGDGPPARVRGRPPGRGRGEHQSYQARRDVRIELAWSRTGAAEGTRTRSGSSN